MKKYNDDSPFKNYEILYNDYWIERLSYSQIAQKYDVGVSVIKYWCRTLKLPTRTKKECAELMWDSVPLLKNKRKVEMLKELEGYKIYDVLYNHYWFENLSMIQIAAKYDVHIGTIPYWFKKLNVPTRNRSEAVKISFQEGRSTPLEAKEKHKIQCSYCKKEIERWRYVIKQHDNHFCCKECKAKYIHENMIGKNAYNWQGGVWAIKCEKRQTLEYKELRKRVLERDGHTCQLCESKRKLVTHHIITMKENLSLALVETNLITLCSHCHCNKVNFREKEYEKQFTDIVKNKR